MSIFFYDGGVELKRSESGSPKGRHHELSPGGGAEGNGARRAKLSTQHYD